MEWNLLIKRAAALLSVKSLVTIVLSGVFAALALRGAIDKDFLTVYLIVVSFYFGTQSQKAQDLIDGTGGDGA